MELGVRPIELLLDGSAQTVVADVSTTPTTVTIGRFGPPWRKRRPMGSPPGQ